MTQIRSLFAFVAALVLAYAKGEEVVALTSSDFDTTIESNPFVLVEFYAPWCGHCKALAPEYEKAAVALKEYEPKVVIAKVDATAEEDLAQRFGVQGFPTLKWFVNGKESDYQGGRVEAEIVQWIKKKTGPPAVTLEDADAVEKFKNEGDVVVVGVFKDETQAKGFLDTAMGDDDQPYAVAYDNSAVEAALGVSAPAVVLFRNFEEPKVEFEGDITSSEELKEFVLGNSLPLVIAFSQETAPKIFGGDIKNHCLLFIDESKKDEMKQVVDAATPVAEKNKGKVMFVSVDKSDSRILEFFGIAEADIPTARIVKSTGEGMKKFKYDGEGVTTDGLTTFTADFLAGSLTPDLKSEEPMDESEQGNVFVLVGKNFDEVINRPGLNVLVEFYAPWCGHCKKLEPEYTALGELYKDNDKVMIAKMDATANEVEAVPVSGFPTLKWFPADSEEIVDFDGERTTDGMKKFIDQQLA